MEMLESSHTLQRCPVLEPQNPILCVPCEPQWLPESLIYKFLNARSCHGEQVALRINCKARFEPDDEVRDVCSPAIGPIIDENFVIARIGERNRICRYDCLRIAFRSPMEAFGTDVVDDGPILNFDVSSPVNVETQLRRLSFEGGEVIGRCMNIL